MPHRFLENSFYAGSVNKPLCVSVSPRKNDDRAISTRCRENSFSIWRETSGVAASVTSEGSHNGSGSSCLDEIMRPRPGWMGRPADELRLDGFFDCRLFYPLQAVVELLPEQIGALAEMVSFLGQCSGESLKNNALIRLVHSLPPAPYARFESQSAPGIGGFPALPRGLFLFLPPAVRHKGQARG